MSLEQQHSFLEAKELERNTRYFSLKWRKFFSYSIRRGGRCSERRARTRSPNGDEQRAPARPNSFTNLGHNLVLTYRTLWNNRDGGTSSAKSEQWAKCALQYEKKLWCFVFSVSTCDLPPRTCLSPFPGQSSAYPPYKRWIKFFLRIWLTVLAVCRRTQTSCASPWSRSWGRGQSPEAPSATRPNSTKATEMAPVVNNNTPNRQRSKGKLTVNFKIHPNVVHSPCLIETL